MIDSKSFKMPILFWLLSCASCLSAEEATAELRVDMPSAASAGTEPKVIIVTAELQEHDLLKLPSSISIFDRETIQRRHAQQLTDLLNLAPNVNFATGASRGRFIQIRGIGERSEFIENTNPSVGVILDGIDLTGISNAASMLDIQQVEILRGPQGTLYGANALAGLINIVSNAPTDYPSSSLESNIETYGGRQLSLTHSGPVNEKLSYRFAYKRYLSDGFIHNLYLKREDTNGFDEQSFRFKLAYDVSEYLSLVSSFFLADIGNGYDAFSLDSNRNSYSDQPGKDTQTTKAFALSVAWEIPSEMVLEVNFSDANSAIEYAYDEDWSYPGICDNTPCDASLFGFDWWYSSYDQYLRQNNNSSLDIKLSSPSQENLSWVAGFYGKRQSIDFKRLYTYAASDFSSQQDKTNLAFYGQLTQKFADAFKITGGLRFEQVDQAYSDNEGVAFQPKENLWGGRLSLNYDYAPDQMLYMLISRGYKAGGVNANASVPVGLRTYKTEVLWNYEAGIKGRWFDRKLQLELAVFYQDRKNIQSKQFIVRSIADGMLLQDGGICPCSFTGLVDNAAAGKSRGLEVSVDWRVTDRLKLYQSLGLLKTEYTDYLSYTHIAADLSANPPLAVDLSGRAFAQAPQYQWVLGGAYQLTAHFFFNLEFEGKGAYYFSDTHEAQSSPYQRINLGLSYEKQDWKVRLYADNILDKRIETRAFGTFGNDPRNFYQTDIYYQLAAPRLIGLSFEKSFE